MSQRREDASGLQALVYRDFRGGLWERGNEREVPQNGLIECTDCMPLPSGGLRAAWAWREESVANLPTNRRVTGFQVERGNSAGGLVDANILSVGLVLGSTSTASFLYEYWFTSMVSNTPWAGWTSGPTYSSHARLFPSRFVTHKGASNRVSWYYNIAGDGPSANSGVFRVESSRLDTPGSTQIQAGNAFFVATHQDRLIWVDNVSFGQPADRLEFTEPSTDAAPATSNRLIVGAYAPGNVVYMESLYPQDLLLLKQNSGGFLVQGDIGGGPFVMSMFTHSAPEAFTWGARTPFGIAYMTEREGVRLWSGGQDNVSLSKQFLGSPMTQRVWTSGVGGSVPVGWLGELEYIPPWLFTPRGYVYDFDMGCWFRTTLPEPPGIYHQWSHDPINNRLYGAGSEEPGNNLSIVSVSTNPADMLRAPTFAMTLPLVDLIERGVQVRQIEVFGQGFGNGGIWTVEITNDKGQSETKTQAVPARAASMRLITKLDGDWLKVRVVSEGAGDASSSTGKSEAPMIDRVVLWARPHHRRVAG